MAISEAIKKYLAEVCGNGSVTEAGCDKVGIACMVDTALPSPLPSGVTRADICNAAVYDWCALNYGYTPSGEAGEIQAGECEIHIGTFPGGAEYWIDEMPPTPRHGITKDISTGEADVIPVTCGRHCVHYRLAGYDDYSECADITPTEHFVALMVLDVVDVALAKSGTLKVNALDAKTGKDIDYAIVKIRSEKAKTGGAYLGFTPLTKEVAAGTYNIVVNAKGYVEEVRRDTIKMGAVSTINAKLEQLTLGAIIKIIKPGEPGEPGAPGAGYIDGIGLKPYEVWWVGTKVKDWIRVATPSANYFQAELRFSPDCPRTPIWTERKRLTAYDTATERHLDFEWLVPDAPGIYTVTAYLYQG